MRGRAKAGIAFLSPLGGVGRTAVALGVGKSMAADHSLRVLFVDLDPHGAASVALLGEDECRRHDAGGRTLARLFDGGVSSRRAGAFDAEACLVRGLGGVGGAGVLDLVPWGFGVAASAAESMRDDTLHAALVPLIRLYDHVIIDCPSGPGAPTRNGLRCATAYVVPVFPDVPGATGVGELADQIRAFSEETGWPIRPLGVARVQVGVGEKVFPQKVARIFHRRDREAGASLPAAFDTVVRLNAGAPRDPGDGGASRVCVEQEANESLRRLTSEIIGRCHDRQRGVGTGTMAGG